MKQIDQRRLFNFAWCRWSYWNDNGSSATSGKRVGNTTGKDDTEIPESEFGKYSDIANISDLCTLRSELFSTTFSVGRNTALSK